jgi:surface antigen
MIRRRQALFTVAMFATSLLLAFAPTASARADECVPYARSASGIALYGAAWTWWEQATGVYGRGNLPTEGAVLIFKRRHDMPAGHVAVVTDVVGPREIRIEHANWGKRELRGKVQYNIRVIDVSRENDWSEVRVWYPPVADFGSAYSVYGFVYRADTPALRRAAAPRPTLASLPLLHAASWLEFPDRHYTH